ncbi:response regulator [Methylobacterium platani]|uniref:histidine kinase n=2 Tax=Methylobacterium platani TaxID=427683 RepID=A0A179RXQ2_9HYPH|nr:response regulator [Methylobacterium platani]KMO22108.1 ATPase [Methylobacterium platani JCM 14648]OAS15170.1 hybrid sensor histidine kinase/response regulator [Methylobacterium platani]
MPAASPASLPRILLVEDSETQALQLRLFLERSGFSVVRHATAEAALEAMNHGLPDLVVADYHLPGMNGDELTRQMRLAMRTRATPVLMLTEASGRDIERQGLESGADAYVPKSADRDLLLLRIRALLRERAAVPADEPGRAASFRRARILVVDGSATFRAYLSALLGQEGHEVVTADGPDQAMAALDGPGEGFDCVTVDLLGSGFDAIALCRRIDAFRGAATGAGAPGFYLVGIGSAAASSKDLLVEAFSAGADDVVAKGADADLLAIRVRTLVRRKLLEEDDRRVADEVRRHALAAERAKAEATAAEAKAALAGALAQANHDLEQANHRLKDTQAKLVQAAKMASLGELVAGIAHEINNPLAFILAHQGTVERLIGEVAGAVPEGDPSRRALDKARDRVGSMRLGLSRIQDLVVNLRKFSRLDEGEMQTVNVPDAIENVLALIQHKLGTRIAVRRDFAGAAEIRCSPALLNQVVMNILGNAADAIPGDGSITIETAIRDGHDVIRICDSGPGVPEELRERIFEPFFTTKPVGSGTGLGLAIAYSVVQAHSGQISVESAPEGGACFVISIPRRAA